MIDNNQIDNNNELEESHLFPIQDEYGRNRMAELLTILEVDGLEYAVYSVDENEEESEVFVARIVKDSEGNDNLISIEDEEEKAKVFEIVQKMINES